MESYVNEMQRCYDRQSEAIRQILKAMPQTLEAFGRFCRDCRCVVLMGIGSSYHALHMVGAYAQEILNVPVFVQTPEQLDWISVCPDPDLMVIAASQSGTSVNVLVGIRKLKSKHVPVAAITQNPDSPVGREADCVIPLCIPEEKAGPKTMGVLATAVTAAFALCRLCEQAEERTAEFEVACEAFVGKLEENLSVARRYALRYADALKEHRTIVVTGGGNLSAAAGEAALKLTETLREPAVSYEVEEWVHGPCACLSNRTALMCLSTQWNRSERLEALCRLCKEAGSDIYDVIVTQEETVEQKEKLLLSCPRHPLLSALMLLLPAQAIGAWISPQKGIDLDSRVFPAWTDVLCAHLSDDER